MNLRLNANAVITNKEGKILLVRQKKGAFPGKLCIPGGGIDPGELGEETTKREVFEETGIMVQNLKALGYCELINQEKASHRVVLLFHGAAEGMPQENDEAESNWYTYAEAEKDLIPFAKEAIRIWKSKEMKFIIKE